MTSRRNTIDTDWKNSDTEDATMENDLNSNNISLLSSHSPRAN